MNQNAVGEPSVDAMGAASAVPPAPTAADLPGRRLREAREARGLSLADAANALKFSPRQIEALEADDYLSLQGATFVRGFVRSYARFLKLAPEPLLAMLDAGLPLQISEVRPPDDTGAAMPLPGERRLSAWVAAAVVLSVIAAALIAWHFISPEFSLPSPRDVAEPKVEAQPTVQAPVVRIEPPVATPAVADANLSSPAPAVLPADGRQLVFLFSDKSWVEVKDSSQRVVLSGEFPGGGRQVAVGKPPLQLWVGRASAVRVLDGEREIDLKPHARDEVARLTVE